MEIPDRITCPECGGRAGRLTFLPEDEPLDPGSVVAYRCPDCMERFDLVIDDLMEDGEPV